MKKYKILESWHNGCDNAENELYATCDNKADAKELLLGLGYKMQGINSLGEDFPEPAKLERVHVAFSWLETKGVLTAWIGADDSHPMGSEHRRIFHIVEAGKWDFTYDEEFPDTAGQNIMGILTDGEHFLFWHAFAHEEGQTEICHIYDSIAMQPENTVCTYPWTAENDSILLNALNSLENPDDYCGEGSPLMTLQFKGSNND